MTEQIFFNVIYLFPGTGLRTHFFLAPKPLLFVMHYAASVEEEKLKELPRNKPDTCTSSAFDFILPVWITIAWLNRRHSAKYSIRFKDATENRELGGERSGREETRTRKGKCLGNVMGSRRLFSEASHQNPKNRAKLTLLFFLLFCFIHHLFSLLL